QQTNGTVSLRVGAGEVAPRTAKLYLVEPTTPCGCAEDETSSPTVSDLVTLTVSHPGANAELFDFQLDFLSEPQTSGLPTTVPTGAATLAEDGTYQHVESFLFTAANGYAAGHEPLIVLYKSCSCDEVPEAPSLTLVMAGLVSLLICSRMRGQF